MKRFLRWRPALLTTIAILSIPALLAQQPGGALDGASVTTARADIARVIGILPVDLDRATAREKVDAASEVEKFAEATRLVNALDAAGLRELIRTAGNINALAQIAAPKVVFWENIGLGGRSGVRSAHDGRLHDDRDLQGVAVSSLTTVGSSWFWFWADEEFRGSVLAVEGAQEIRNLHTIPKKNSFPFGLGDGHWGDEINGVQILNGPPQCGGVTGQPGRPGHRVDGITIIRAGGNIQTCY